MTRIGVWQGPCAIDPASNFSVAERAVSDAERADCSFVCLPECFLTSCSDPEVVRRNAFSVDDERLASLARRAGKANVTLLVGFAERRAECLYNTQAVLVDGRVVGSYSKIMLSTADRELLRFTPGARLPVFESQGIRFGIQICHDSRFPEIAASMEAQGARILFSPHFNLIGPARVDAHIRRARAAHVGLASLYGMIVARSNIVAADDFLGRLGYGDSAIFDPLGTSLAEAGLFTEGLLTADVTPWLESESVRVRHELPSALIEQSASLVLNALTANREVTDGQK